jgi:hypothetical protein
MGGLSAAGWLLSGTGSVGRALPLGILIRGDPAAVLQVERAQDEQHGGHEGPA